MTEPTCVICGAEWRSNYTDELQWVCKEHWNRVPPKLRREWWVDTDYGKRDPSAEIIDALRAHFG